MKTIEDIFEMLDLFYTNKHLYQKITKRQLKYERMSDNTELIGKTIVYAEIGGYGVKLAFSDGSILDYNSSSDGDSCWEIIEDDEQADRSKEKLKPCPFCGGSDIDIRTDDGGLSWYSFCNDCGVMCGYSTTKDDVVNAWNRRTEGSE